MKQTTLTILIVLIAFSINAQTIITGTVSDYTGPLPFANVSIEGTDAGTIADAKGDFSIEVHRGDILTISYVGFIPKHITIENVKHLDVSLEIDSLDEVIITTYGTTRCTYTTRCYFNYIETSSLQSITRVVTTTNMAYPNPTSTGYVTLNLDEQYSTIEMSVHSITGQRLIHQTYDRPNQNLSVDLSSFAKGVYLINITADGETLPPQKIIRS